jgi:aminopeptidase N
MPNRFRCEYGPTKLAEAAFIVRFERRTLHFEMRPRDLEMKRESGFAVQCTVGRFVELRFNSACTMFLNFMSNRWGALAFLSVAVLLVFGPARADQAFSLATTPGKLPKTVLPVHYALDLKPDLDALSISGSENVDIKVLNATDRVVLNSLNIAIASASIDGKPGEGATVSLDPKAQTATLTFSRPIEVGAHQLRIAFTSRINQFSQGLFFVDYPTSSGRRRMFATQLEPTDARRIFPCWDEPAFKASFEPTVTVPANFLAVSNMPIAHQDVVAGGLRRLSFRATPPMSSYLFVLVGGELARITGHADGVEVGVVAQAGREPQGRYALATALELLRYYDGYFGVKYPLPKLDLIAVPGGFGGAMENWGGITFYDGYLLYDPVSSPRVLQRRIYGIIAHEMAHQWFGDLVTTAWWSDLWLNEGFADWMQAKVENHFHPDWEVFLNESRKQDAMYADARMLSHPIKQRVADESEAAIAFDEITYEKGAAIVRVIEDYLGEAAFRAGIRRYVNEHAYSNATTEDLWAALEKSSGEQVAPIARSYTEQAGVPLIIADEKCADGRRTLTVKQERFTIYYPDAPPALWQVPINWGLAGENKPNATLLLHDKSAKISAGQCGPPLKLNVGDVGYYRVQYDAATRAALTQTIEKMQPGDRVNLLADSWALLEAGRLTPADYFPLVTAVSHDRNRAVWREVIDAFTQVDRLELGQAGRVGFQAYARSVLRPAFDRVGWDAAANEPEDVTILRSALISALGELNDPEIAAESRRRFAVFLENPASLDVNLRDALVGVVGRNADQQTYDALGKLARTAGNGREQMRYYSAMARASDPKLIERTLHLALTDELAPERASELILIVAMGEHPELALQFATANFNALAAKHGPEFRYFFMSRLMSNFVEPSYAKQLANFAPAQETSGGRIEALRAEARIMESAGFREHQLREIDRWIETRPAHVQARDELTSSSRL